MRITWIALVAAGALMTMPSTATALPQSPLGDHAAAVAKKKREKRKRAERRREQGFAAAPVPTVMQSIAACESGGNPRAISADGTYRGKYQFDHQTWAAMGGSGDPAAASEAEQDMRAARLYAQAGASPWPVCGR